MFIDGYERSDAMGDWNNFLTRIEDLKPYMAEFEENDAMKPKNYSSDYKVRSDDCRPIIVITYDECTFSAHDEIQRAWTRIRDIYYNPKVVNKA